MLTHNGTAAIGWTLKIFSLSLALSVAARLGRMARVRFQPILLLVQARVHFSLFGKMARGAELYAVRASF
jgi:hypothetical protein